MIDPDNKDELKLIAGLVAKDAQPKGVDPLFISSIIIDAVRDAINSSNDLDEAIKYIIITHPILLIQLKEVIKENYPDKLADVEKLALLI